MSIEKVRDFFGIKYVIPYNLTTFQPIVVLRVVGEISFENKVDQIELKGGDTQAPWDVEFGQPSPTLKGTLLEYPGEIFQIMETCTKTVVSSSSPSGSISTSPTNGQGVSIIAGSNGISSVTISQAASLIFGRYTLVATGAQTLDLYIAGLVGTYDTIQGRVVASISTTTSGTVAIAAAGISLTVVGTPNFTVGDTAYFEVQPINTGTTTVLIGAGTSPSSFGVRCVFPRKTDGVLHYIDVFNVSARGLAWMGKSRQFSSFDIEWKPLARSSDGAVYQVVRVLGS